MNTKQQQLEKAERAWYRAKARAEQAVDRLSDCERKVARLREELNCAEVLGRTLPGPKSQNTQNARKTGAASIARRRFKISVTEREHATILAALRLWQEADEHNRGDLRDIAEAAGVPLSNQEIDVLCERINFASHREA
jgi:ClpP class serine protease